MVVEILLWLNILICPVAGVILLTRRPYSAAVFFFCFGLFFVSGLTFLELQILGSPEQMLFWRHYAVVFEVLAAVSLYFYTKTSFRDNSLVYKGYGFWVAIIVAGLLLSYAFYVPPENLVFSPDFAEEKILFLTRKGFVFYLFLMVFLVLGLVQLERTLTTLHQLQRWKIKLEIIGSGLLMAAFALYFSHSLLYRSINMDFLSIRSTAVLLAISLVVYSRLFRGDGTGLALSRGIAHRSFVLLIVGGYLILLGVIGEGLRYLNISNARSLFYILLLFGSLGLAVIFLSERLRRKLKVILHKNFYQSKYDYRDQWEKFAKRLSDSSSAPEMQVSILDFLCGTFACKGAAFYLLDSETQTYQNTAYFNFRRDWRPFPAADSLVVKLQEKDWIINLSEVNPELTDSLIDTFAEAGAFLVTPLFFDEKLAGFIVLGEQINRGEELTYEDYDLLRMLARQTIATVQGLRLAEQLSTSRELAAIGKVSTFVLHDLKNQVSGLSLMLDNAHEYIADPDFQKDMLETVGNTVSNMRGLIARLKNLKEKPELVVGTADLKKIIQDAVETVGAKVEVVGEPVDVAVDEEEIYKVVLNLLVNAVEATDNEVPAQVKFGSQDDSVYVRVSDSGSGMSADFIKNKLFKPFETTKKHGFGIGLYQCRQIIESHGGSIGVESREGKGTTFTVLLPRLLATV